MLWVVCLLSFTCTVVTSIYSSFLFWMRWSVSSFTVYIIGMTKEKCKKKIKIKAVFFRAPYFRFRQKSKKRIRNIHFVRGERIAGRLCVAVTVCVCASEKLSQIWVPFGMVKSQRSSVIAISVGTKKIPHLGIGVMREMLQCKGHFGGAKRKKKKRNACTLPATIILNSISIEWVYVLLYMQHMWAWALVNLDTDWFTVFAEIPRNSECNRNRKMARIFEYWLSLILASHSLFSEWPFSVWEIAYLCSTPFDLSFELDRKV